MFEIVKHYRNDATLRASFNALAEATFGLNFENWYQNGFWTDAYDPYSILEDGKIVANVSLNRTDFVMDGQRRRIYQLGTVMTYPEYRNRGYIRLLMAEIEKDTADADGVYLFGNDSVVEFYPKFGFRKGVEHICTREVSQGGACTMVSVPMNGPAGWSQLRQGMELGEPLSAWAMVDNPGLFFFYVAQFMQNCVYHEPKRNIWAIAELEDGELLLHNVFASRDVTMEEVIAAFGAAVKKVTLGFAPKNADSFHVAPWHEEDCNFFVKGQFFDGFAEAKLRIPTLSHA